MRIAGYILAIVVGISGLIGGVTGKQWWLFALALGFLAFAIFRIARSGSARVEAQKGKAVELFAIFTVTGTMEILYSVLIFAGGFGVGALVWQFILRSIESLGLPSI
jgi:hypothetical protein